MTQFPIRRRVLVLALIAAGVVGSLAFYRIHSPAGTGLAWFAPPVTAPTQAPLSNNDVSVLSSYNQAMEALAAHVKPAVVEIVVTARSSGNEPNSPMEQFFGQFFGQMPRAPRIERGLGSGVIISPDGYIVTNNHVVQDATTISVLLANHQMLPGKVVGTDELTDLAVVKINGSDLPTLPWGDSSQVKPGETVLAVGNPFGGEFEFSVTHGIVSGVGRGRLRQGNLRALGDFIQTDAAINPGNSGGPLVNIRGEVIGINSAIFTSSGAFAGIGFAIPSNIAHKVAGDLIKNGKVEHGYLGILITDITPENMRFFNIKEARGALVQQVDPDTPAARAGLKAGDVITAINGQPVRDSGQLQVTTSLSPPGTPVTLTVMRNGQPMTVHTRLGSPPTSGPSTTPNQRATTTGFHLGVRVAPLTPDQRQQENIPGDIQGVLVQSVDQGSAADNAGLQPGVVIMEVNHQPVHNPDELGAALEKLPPDQSILLRLWLPTPSGFGSAGTTAYRVVEPNLPAH